MTLMKTVSIIPLLAGVYLLLHAIIMSIYWVFHVEELSKKTDAYWKTYGIRSGFGYFLIVVAYTLWYPDMQWLFPYGVLASIIGGAGSANGIRRRQNIADRLYENKISKTNDIK